MSPASKSRGLIGCTQTQLPRSPQGSAPPLTHTTTTATLHQRNGTATTTYTTARLSRDASQLFTLLRFFEQAGVRVEYSTGEGQGDKSLELLLSALAALQDGTLRSKQAQ
jgi:hypothetical protein